MLELFRKAAKSGLRSSEFWLAVLAVALPYADTAAQNAHGTAGVVASAAVAAAYAVGRSYVKGKQLEATAQPAASVDALEQAGTAAAAAVRDSSSSSAGQFAPRP